MFSRVREILLGKPLATKAILHERLSNTQALAIFGADALSSTAYATEEILRALAGIGVLALFVSIPIAFLIAALIFIVSLSYTQVIHVYPQGGGVYNVARKNLGEYPALVGGASLLVDYMLTVAVSVAAGVAAITSALPELFPYKVYIGVAIIVVLTIGNLRGIRESGKLFSVPTYFFILSFLGMIGYGVWQYFNGSFSATIPSKMAPVGSIGIFLLFHAFASGCTAMTGIEAISNGVQAFKSPESSNAAKTLLRMAFILGIIFIGVTMLSYWQGIQPASHETVISQIARNLFGTTPIYFLVQAVTGIILLLAANTPFVGFPRVASQLAKDGYFPHQFLNLGSKLVFKNGIFLLAAAAILLLMAFDGDVHALIPLYAVGVFLGFSLSQLGMVIYWLGHKGQIWKICLNSFGFISTTAVFCIVLSSKFFEGAWMLVPATILLVSGMKYIHNHYNEMEKTFSFDGASLPPTLPNKTMIVLVSRFDWASVYAAKHVRALYQPLHLRAVHVAIDAKEGEVLKQAWNTRCPDIPIDVLISEYRDLISPILEYLKEMERKWSNDSIIVVIPEVVPKTILQRLLHNQTAMWIRLSIEQDPDIQAEILDVPVKISTKFQRLMIKTQ